MAETNGHTHNWKTERKSLYLNFKAQWTLQIIRTKWSTKAFSTTFPSNVQKSNKSKMTCSSKIITSSKLHQHPWKFFTIWYILHFLNGISPHPPLPTLYVVFAPPPPPPTPPHLLSSFGTPSHLSFSMVSGYQHPPTTHHPPLRKWSWGRGTERGRGGGWFIIQDIHHFMKDDDWKTRWRWMEF